MGLVTEWVRFGNEEQYSGYFAKPDQDSDQLPAVIVLQEIWGVDAHIQDVTRRFAQAGYAAFAPELFGEKGGYKTGLDPDSVMLMRQFMDELPHGHWQDQEKRAKALELRPERERTSIQTTMMQMFDPAIRGTFVEAALAASEWLHQVRPETKGGRIGSVGFCLGGMLSALVASRDPNLNAAVVFYGTPISRDRLGSIACPVLGHYGELDLAITDKVPEFEEAMKELGNSIEVHIYPQTPHAFFNDGRASYRSKAAREAFARTLSFFAEHLG
ncbi:dienelactone hydrolase family protein [Paenibacillus frigoriresistens]|uniref:dienelactone hydrolase family protein n=1 Tax=Paenibacillus alginolyticus TaxID=59839 RepID=UPI001563C4F5|nr:dienelactone hydrolase family protein [Paenibacillus frigoriresistens]NRF95708.1 dienelactone hydrolase family protein [Paenibacillus frigoriresistens]